jgi:hypothetical protein
METRQPASNHMSSVGGSNAPPTSQPRIACDWPHCTFLGQFAGKNAQSQHVFNVHIKAVLDQDPGRCTWPGCTSKASLKSRKLLETHVYNLHIDPLRCEVRGCGHTRPFAKQSDLERHRASAHRIGRTFKCPQKNCERYVRPFPRKDKLQLHIRHRSMVHSIVLSFGVLTTRARGSFQRTS